MTTDRTPLDYTRTPEEAHFLLAYRAADAGGKKRIRKLLRAAALGLLPSVAQIKAMTQVEMESFADALPEVLS